jgi:hypothetical protein
VSGVRGRIRQDGVQGLEHHRCVFHDDGIRTLKEDGLAVCSAQIALIISAPRISCDAFK